MCPRYDGRLEVAIPERPRILFLTTGGTLGMAPSHGAAGPLAPSSVAENLLPFVRGLQDEIEVEDLLLFNLDSSDLGPAHWTAIGQAIVERIDRYDGFVVVHGTDTMAWTASALSFALWGLPRPVVLTGAQRPIAMVRSDAVDNLVNAALCAAMDIPEVSLFFGRALYRGNRATKTSIQSYDAFESPDCPPLLEVGLDIRSGMPPRYPKGVFTPVFAFAEDVAVLDVVPGSGPGLLLRSVEAGARAVLLRGFGAGNVPRRGWPDAIRTVVDAGVPVALRSQCVRGAVDLRAYEGGRAALDAGAMSTGAMTLEASAVKLMHLVGLGLSGEVLRATYAADLAGEGASGDP
jgi:L-asparaginase